MTGLDKDFRGTFRSLTNKFATGVNTLKRSATITSTPTIGGHKYKQRRRSSFMALLPPTFTHHSQTSTSNNENSNNTNNTSTMSCNNSDASTHGGGDFSINSVIEVHGAKFVEVKRKGETLESVEVPKPTAKELELYRELETIKMALKIAETALNKQQATRKAVPKKDAANSPDAFAVQFPARSDSQAWKLNIGRLKILPVFSRRPTIAAQHRTLGKLNDAGIFLVECEELAEVTGDSRVEEAYHN